MYKCKFCNKEFEKPSSVAAHVSSCKLNPNFQKNLEKRISSRKLNNKKISRKKILCEKCNCEIDVSQFSKHTKTCAGKKKDVLHLNEEWLNKITGKYKCPICDKEYTKNGICTHIQFTHNGKYPYPTLGKTSFKKGHTKENDESIKRASETWKQNYELGKFKSVWKDKNLSEGHKLKVSIGRKKWIRENRDKHNWFIYQGKETEPEKRFREVLEKLNIDDKIIQQYIPPENDRLFALDFVLLESKIAFEINGNFHYNDDGSLQEYYQKRHDYFENNGWKIIEIPYLLCFHEDKIKIIIEEAINNKVEFLEERVKEIFHWKQMKKAV